VGSTGCSELDGGSAADGTGAGLDSSELVRPGTVIIGPEVGALLEVDALRAALLGAA
jgi:hypothetical protein